MRLDKFLKISRIIKRRTIANEITTNGRVKVNEKVAKAGTGINVGDEILINFGFGTLKIKVLKISDNVSKSDSDSLYKILEKTSNKSDELNV